MAVTASAALGACVLAALPLVGLVAHADESVLGRGSSPDVAVASSDASVASAQATVRGVHGLSAEVDSSPNQRVTGRWTAVCKIGVDEGRLFDTFTGQTPLDVTIPMTMTRTGTCTIRATARASRGRVTVELHGT